MTCPVDLPRIRRALAELDRIAVEHPEIRHWGQPWANDMNQLQETIMTPGKERIAKYRAKQREKGLKTVNVFLTPEAQAALNKLQSERPDATMGDVISDALLIAIATRKQP
jgi:deferrochelatase/peroxidase EfeB